jgi:hypothetical protein
MKLFTSILATLAAGVSAQIFTNQSAPFSLQVVSTSAQWNGQYLAACHEGAAIEALCPAGTDNPEPFLFNYSSIAEADPSTQGYLTWVLHASNINVSSPMRLAYDPTTNLAVPMLQPDFNGQLVGFNADNFLFIQGFDASIWPRNESTITQYYRWFVCETAVGYVYNTLAWGLGPAAPENPTCSDVQVKRIFV